MNREEIIQIAQEAGLWEIRHSVEMAIGGVGELERFAAFVIANNPPQSSMAWQEGYEAGKQTEREACAKMCDDLDDDIVDGLAGWQYGEAIRARGKHDTR